METWWDRYPDALAAEKTALDATGYSWTENQEAKQNGRLLIQVEVPFETELLKLTAVYPDTFPYFPPQVFLENKVLKRHQHLVGKNLCLLARESEDWNPGNETLAKLLQEQLPVILDVIQKISDEEFVARHEDHVGEPLSSFLPYPQNSVIIVPDETPSPQCNFGRLALHAYPITRNVKGKIPVNGILGTISDSTGRVLVRFPVIPPAYSGNLSGYWVRLPERPKLEVGPPYEQQFYHLFCSKYPSFNTVLKAAKAGQTIIAGFVFPDEVSWRDSSDDWVFLAIRVKKAVRGGPRVPEGQLQFIRSDWGGEIAWMRRAPQLRPLRNKSALMVGLGSLGSPLSIHLARAGIKKLHLIDCDHLQVGNTVRWALGWRYAGCQKSLALADQLQNEYPYTEAVAHDIRIGAPTNPNEEFFSDYQLIRDISEEVDLIVDASASHRVSHFLSDLANELGKPYLWLTTTHGAAGGVVGRIIPGRTEGCWHCFQHNLADGSIRLPADLGSREIQPGGCSQPTFIGAGIDCDEISLLASRLAVATLCSDDQDGYPDFNWEVAVADLKRNGASLAAEWHTQNLTTNKACTTCRAK